MSEPIAPLAFYCVSGRDFFPGAVALLNSLRLVGHREPLHVLDCGLSERQRGLLEPHATLVDAPSGQPPSMLKLAAPLAHPAEVMAMLDADIILTRSISGLADQARADRLVGFRNDTHRHFAEWGALLGLEAGSLREGPYLISSALLAGGALGRDLLPEIAERLAALDVEQTWLERGSSEGHPFYFADQDVINAVALARLDPDRVVAHEARLAAVPPFAGLRLVDRRRLRCAYRDGTEPLMLHHFFRKPWLVAMRSNPYSRLLTRLLLADDVALRLDPGDLPWRLREGARGAAMRLAVDYGVGIPAYAKRRLRPRPRITAWPNESREAERGRG